MANGPKTTNSTNVANNNNNNHNNNNNKETPKKKKRSPTGKLPGAYSPNSEPLALNNNNNNNTNNNNSDGSTLKSVVVTLTTPIATTTITISNVNLNNSNISPLGKQGSDAGSVLFTPNVRKHELPGCIPQSHHPPVLNNGTTGTGSPGRGVSTPSPPPAAAPAPVVVAPPKVTTPASPLRQNTPPPPPPHAQHLPPPAPAPTIAHFPVTNGPLVGHPGLSNHPRLPTPPPAVPTTLVSQSPRTTASAVSSTYPPPPSNYPLSAPQLSLPPAPNPAYLSPHPVVTTSYAPPPPSSVYPPPHCTTGLSVTSNSNPVVVAAPSSYVTPSTLPLSNYPPLYAPYNSTPYLSSMPASKSLVASQLNDFLHQRMDRSPLPVISSKPAERPSGIVTTATAVVTTTTTTSHRDILSTPLVGRSHSPRGHSPTRERDSYSSNVSSLSRGSVTPVSCPPPPTNSSPFSVPVSAPSGTSSLPFNNKASVWVGGSSGAQLSPANTVSRHPLAHTHPHPFPPPVFAPPVAAAPSAASTIPAPPTGNPNPFSAESLFQSNQADLLRRELDTRFLASQERTLVPPPYLRTEMHHHQHQHTHVHQHTAPLLPPPPPTLYTPPIFKDIPKLGGVDSPFYRQNLGLSSYPGFSPGLLHPTLGAATPFAPPNHLPTFTPKHLTETSKPKPVKTGKWNAMHVRIAWEIYHHQQKQAAEVKAGVSVAASSIPTKSELLRPPSHLFPAAPPRPHDLSPFAAHHRAPHTAFENPAHPGTSPFSTIGGSMFGRYPPAATAFPSLAAFPHGPLHDPWSRLQPRSTTFPSSVTGPWSLKPEPGVTDAEREREREREREKERERSRERERCRREEKQRKLLAAQQSKVRERSPLREPPPVVPKEEEVVLLGRPPPHYLPRHPTSRTLPPHFGHHTPWDHPYRFDPLRFNPLMAFRTEEEEQRAKLFGTYPPPPPHLRAKAPSPHRTGATLPHTHGHADIHKKEESSQSR